MAAPRVVRTRLVRTFLDHLTARGLSVGPLLARVGLPLDAATAPELGLPINRLHAFYAAAEVFARDPWLGLHVAVAIPRGHYGLYEYVSRNAPTLGEIYRLSARFGALVSDSLVFRYELELKTATIRAHVADQPLAHGRHASEFLLAVGVETGRQSVRQAWIPEAVVFAHPRPRDIRPLEDYFRARRLLFGRGYNAIVLSRADAALPVPNADPALLGVLETRAARELPADPGGGIIHQVRSAVRNSLRIDAPLLDTVATQLGISTRSLQRRVAAEGHAFQDVVDEVRRGLAMVCIREPSVSAKEMAYLLGYADPGTLYRAFRRWTGMTPAAYRKRYG
jgi:AraC-like DNA-binding protein